MKKVLAILLAILLNSFSPAVYGGIGSASAQTSDNESLAGKYILVSWKNGDVDYVDFFADEGISAAEVYIELQIDGTYTWDLSVLDMEIDVGTYQVLDSATLLLSYSGGKDQLAINGGHLIYEESDYVLVFEKAGDISPADNSLMIKMAGVYVLTYWKDEGGNFVDYLISIGIDASTIYIALRADGTYTWDRTTLETGMEKGTYIVTGNSTVLLSYDGETDELYIDDDKLCLYSSDGDKIIFEKTSSPIPVRSERWVMTYWRDEASDSFVHVYSDQLRELGIDTDEIYFEFRVDGTFILDLSKTPEYAGVVLEGHYRVHDSADTVFFEWDESDEAENFTRPKHADLIGDGDWLGINLPSATGKWANASFRKTVPTPPFSFRNSLPALARGVYALSEWISEDGSACNLEEFFGDLRSDLAFIDLMENGQFLLSLHAMEPGFFAWGTYWMDGDNVRLEWVEEWDAEYFPFSAIFDDNKIYLRNAAHEVLVFDKDFGCDYPASAVSYRDSYFGSPLGSAKTLEGTVLVVGIFVYNDNTPQWNDEAMAAFRKYLQYSMLYLEEAAYKYGRELYFYQYQTEIGAEDLFYMMKLDGWLAGGDDSDELVRATRVEIDSFIENNIPYLDLADKYRTDNITYVIFTPEFDRSYAWPYFADFVRSEAAERYHEKSIIFTGTNYVLAHEILHTFGAVDLYQEEGQQSKRDYFGVSKELMEYIEEYYPMEVMRRTHMHDPQLSPFTAYRLGWLDDIPELEQFPEFRLPGDMPGIMAEYSYKAKK